MRKTGNVCGQTYSLDHPVLVRFLENFEQFPETRSRHGREFKWICVHRLPLHLEVWGQRMVWRRSAVATNQRQDYAPEPLVKAARSYLNNENDVLGAPGTFANSKMRHDCL